MFDRPSFTHRACLTAVLCVLFCGSPAFAVQMKDDPKGFEGIPWGATLSESETFGKVEDAGRLKTYELYDGPPSFGPAKVESMRFITVDDRFARVTVRYQGKETHDQLLAFLQSRYGSLDRTPGQFRRGRQTLCMAGRRPSEPPLRDAHRSRHHLFRIPRSPAGSKARWRRSRTSAEPHTS